MLEKRAKVRRALTFAQDEEISEEKFAKKEAFQIWKLLHHDDIPTALLYDSPRFFPTHSLPVSWI